MQVHLHGVHEGIGVCGAVQRVQQLQLQDKLGNEGAASDAGPEGTSGVRPCAASLSGGRRSAHRTLFQRSMRLVCPS